MIYSLHGTLVEKTADMAVVECAGVGYCVSIPSSTAGALPAVGQTCTLYTYMNVTETMSRYSGLPIRKARPCSAC